MAEGFELRADVKLLLEAIAQRPKGIGFTDDMVAQAAKRFAALPGSDRQEIGAQLTAVATAIEKKGGEGIHLVLGQLASIVRELTGAVLPVAGAARPSAPAANPVAARPVGGNAFESAGPSLTLSPKENLDMPPTADPSELWK